MAEKPKSALLPLEQTHLVGRCVRPVRRRPELARGGSTHASFPDQGRASVLFVSSYAFVLALPA
jgi:hypothetical protein